MIQYCRDGGFINGTSPVSVFIIGIIQRNGTKFSPVSLFIDGTCPVSVFMNGTSPVSVFINGTIPNSVFINGTIPVSVCSINSTSPVSMHQDSL